MPKATWVVINCTSNEEAWKIGNKLLSQRLIACFDVVARVKTAYFWPPRSGKIEKGKGTMLIGVTLPKKVKKISQVVTAMHSDDIPFLGTLELENVSEAYAQWLRNELK